MRRSAWLVPLVLLALPRVAAAQDAVADRDEVPLPRGHFRVASFEFAETTNVMIIEAMIEAPVGTMITIESRGPGGPGSRSRSGVTSIDGGPTGRLHLLVMLERYGLTGAPVGREIEGYSSFSLYTKGPRSGGGGTSSVIVPVDRPLDEVLVPLMRPGDYRFGSGPDAFRFQNQTYTIDVVPPGEPDGGNP